MNKLKNLLILLFATMIACSSPQKEILDPVAIKAVMTRVVDWQLENLKDSVVNRAERDKVNPIRDDGWIRGTFYSGVMAHYYATSEEKYLDTIMAWGEKNNWLPGPKSRHADDQTVNFEIRQITAGPKHHLFGYIGHALTIPAKYCPPGDTPPFAIDSLP